MAMTTSGLPGSDGEGEPFDRVRDLHQHPLAVEGLRTAHKGER